MQTSMLPVLGLLVLGVLIAAVGSRYRATSKVARRLATSIVRFRELGNRPSRRTPAGADHPALRQHVTLYDAFARDVAAFDGTVLGDWEEFHPDGRSAGVTRWFVDATRQVGGWFGVVSHDGGHAPVTYCLSELEPLAFVTTLRGGSDRRLASPPTLHGAHVPGETPLDDLLSRHRSRLPAGGAGQIRTIATLDDAQAMLDRLRGHVAAWRQAQDPTVLLDLDLRSVLGEHYARFGHAVTRLVRDAAPPA